MSFTRTVGIRLQRHGAAARAWEAGDRDRARRRPGSTDRDARAHLAGDPMPSRDLLEKLLVLRARRHPKRAARVEAAPGGRVDRARHVTPEHDSLALPRRIRDGYGGAV